MITEDNYFAITGIKFIRDPVHKTDIILSPYELDIINTREFQRLRGIKQLGPCEVVWHGATHNRFQHSLGILFMVEQILTHCDPKGQHVPFAKRVVCRLFGLLHDIGHVPFGHTIEDERPAINGHHTDRHRIQSLFNGAIGSALGELEKVMSNEDRRLVGIGIETDGNRRINSLSDLIIELICECKGETDEDESKLPKELQIYLDIVGNTVCADLFDYLRRDAYETGLRRDYDDKIMFDFSIYNDRLVLDIFAEKAGRSGTRTEIVHLLDIRYTLAERVYFNPTKMWAAAMISKAVEMAGLPDVFLFDKRDDELLWLLEHPQHLQQSMKDASINGKINTECKGPITEDIKECLGEECAKIWFDAWRICKHENPDFEGPANLITAYKNRDIFRPLYLVTESSVDTNKKGLFKQHFWQFGFSPFRLALETFLARMCDIEPWQVIISCPNPTMNLKFANPLVGPFIGSGDRYKELNSINISQTNDPNVILLKEGADHVCENHWRLWRFGVLAPESLSRYAKYKLAGLCQDTFRLNNELDEYASSRENLQTILKVKITEAFKIVKDKSPTTDEVEAIMGEVAKGRASQSAPRAYFVEDFINIIKETA